MFDMNELMALTIVEVWEKRKEEEEKEMQKEADREEENEMYSHY